MIGVDYSTSVQLSFVESEPQIKLLPLEQYGAFIVMFSGGKDSTALVLHLLDSGVTKGKIELWHQLIDGNEGSTLMDWPVTPAYCKAFSKALGIPLYFQWREGGFERELMRPNVPIAPTWYETPEGLRKRESRPHNLTRQKFPQVGSIRNGRWCSPKLKIDPSRIALNNQQRFKDYPVCILTGERAEESALRKCYAQVEEFNYAAGRQVDQWRAVHSWNESQVWQIMERWGINPHPCYKAGYSRCSCRH